MVPGKREWIYSMLKKSHPKDFASVQHPVCFRLLFIFYVGTFYLKNANHTPNSMLTKKILKSLKVKLHKLLFSFLCITNLLSRCGDIEVNLDPKYSSLNFCYWNLNDLTAQNSRKFLLLQAYITGQLLYNIPT